MKKYWYGIAPFQNQHQIYEFIGTEQDMAKLMKSLTAARQWNLDRNCEEIAPAGTLRNMMRSGVFFFCAPRKKHISKAMNSPTVLFISGALSDPDFLAKPAHGELVF